jgi:hypothetical protein
MAGENEADRRLPFLHLSELQRLDDALTARIERRTRALNEQIIPASNRQGLKHGRAWQTKYSDNPDDVHEVETQMTETAISLLLIADNDMTCLGELLVDLPKKMHGQFMRKMYELVENSTASTGNVVSGKPFAESFVEMLERISFGTDRWGVPTLPELHIPPAMKEQFEEFIKRPDPAYSARMEKITEAKKKEALANEARRICRFKFR